MSFKKTEVFEIDYKNCSNSNRKAYVSFDFDKKSVVVKTEDEYNDDEKSTWSIEDLRELVLTYDKLKSDFVSKSTKIPPKRKK